jgi:hypothetical protein
MPIFFMGNRGWAGWEAEAIRNFLMASSGMMVHRILKQPPQCGQIISTFDQSEPIVDGF